MTLDEIKARLQNVHGGSARCPAHEDKSNSLSVTEGKNGRVLLKCHAGCTTEKICGALGITVADLFSETLQKKEKPRKEKREFVAKYDYTDENGAFLYRKTRYRTESGGKTFVWTHKDGKEMKIGRGGAEPVLYNLWEAADKPELYMVEGEKDVETLRRMGLTAVSVPDGAASKWHGNFTAALESKRVTIIEDNDEPGKAFAERAAQALFGHAAEVKILDLTREWTDLKPHGDISDVVDMEGSKKDVLRRLEALQITTPVYTPHNTEAAQEAAQSPEDAFFECFRPLSDFDEREAAWLIPGWVPKGQITLLAADGGTGKTTLWCNIVAALSSGRKSLLDTADTDRKPLSVAFLTTEDSVRQKLKRKLREAGADQTKVLTPDFLADKEGLLRDFKFGTHKMASFIRRFRPALCVFDPVQGFIPPEINMGSRNAMRDCMAPLISLGEEYGTTFLIICHTNKRKGASGRDRIADTADLWDIARSVLMMGYTEDAGVRYLSNEKNNYASLQETVLFTIDEAGQPHRSGTSMKRDREYMLAAAAEIKNPTLCNDCKEALLQVLDENECSMAVKDMEAKLKEFGYGYHTIRKAKEELCETSAIRVKPGGKGAPWVVEKTEFSEPDTYTPPSDI